jgi:hypothetical protein
MKRIKAELVIWIAEYSYSKANNGTEGKPPSIVYEQVERDLDNLLKE